MLPLRKYKCTPLKRPENTAFLAFLAMHTPLSNTLKQADFEPQKDGFSARGVHFTSACRSVSMTLFLMVESSESVIALLNCSLTTPCSCGAFYFVQEYIHRTQSEMGGRENGVV